MTDSLSKKHRRWNMSRIRARDTAPELLVRSTLHNAGYRFILHSKTLPGRPDIVLPRYRAVIFVNGCFWHRHKACRYAYTPKSRKKFWQDKFRENVARDRRNLKALQALGWNVFTIWECHATKPDQLLRNVTRLIRRSRVQAT